MAALTDTAYMRYLRFLEQSGEAPYGFAKELADLTTRRKLGVKNSPPPEALWPAILPTLRRVVALRETFGPTTITSGYRSPAYNAIVGGELNSWHSKHTAIDCAPRDGTPAEWAAFLRGQRDAGKFKGGIGTYTRRGFVHVDTRGVNRDWGR